jgi:hypothetical protein
MAQPNRHITRQNVPMRARTSSSLFCRSRAFCDVLKPINYAKKVVGRYGLVRKSSALALMTRTVVVISRATRNSFGDRGLSDGRHLAQGAPPCAFRRIVTKAAPDTST